MRDSLRSRTGRPGVGCVWVWVLALLALPNCSFDPGRVGPGTNLNKGPRPHVSAIFCDIEKVLTRHCATDPDKIEGMRLAEAAVALNTGRKSVIGLDESPEARARCGGEPEAVTFHGPFPDGVSVCLNCPDLPPPYADTNAACVALCTDLFSPAGPEVPADPLVVAFCEQRARASTNHPANPDPCFVGGCADGMLRPDFVDPRRVPEPVVWRDLIGVSASGNDLTRTAATTGQFDAGAVSTQWITKGDAYVEFAASAANRTHVIGFSTIPVLCLFPCADTDPSLVALGFGIQLNVDGRFYVTENAVPANGPDVNRSFGTYAAGGRFRVSVRDHSDGTGTISYSRIIGPCIPGAECNENVFYTSMMAPARYPLRVDTSFREQGATLTDVRVVYIK